jgi:uncharacterized cofD-like protein
VSDESVRAHGIGLPLLTTEPLQNGQPDLRIDAGSRRVRVVALGGGTGLSVLLGGLRTALFPSRGRRTAGRDRERLTAIVTTADDGGSSGRLRRAYGMVPPGDIRKCLVALSDGDPTLAAIFNFRFNGHQVQDVGGHSLGNLILTALSQIENDDFLGALDRANHILGARGRVLPSSLDDVRLVAEFTDGSRAEGESRIASARRLIRRVRLVPETAHALPQALRAIAAADLIVIGPGSLYTSLIPVLLLRDLAGAIARARARVVLVMNLMTEPGETDGAGAREHLLAIRRHAPRVRIHDVFVNSAPIPSRLAERYAADGALPITPDVDALQALGCRVVEADLLAPGYLVRHDPNKLARAVLHLAQEVRS